METDEVGMDRWLEVDIDWFGPRLDRERIADFCARIAPLLATATGDRGVIVNIGWLSDIVTEWTGDGSQALPLRSRRYEEWATTSYDDLGRFVADLKGALRDSGIDNPLVGIFITGLGSVVLPPATGEMYDLYSDWAERHPELYPLDISTLPGSDLDPRVPLKADDYPYATHPTGVAAGISFAQLLGDQWGSLSRFAGLDVIHLRDGYWGPMLYNRTGPYGRTASPDPAENHSWTTALIDIIRCVKRANPDALVMAYSSAVSHTAEWRVGCIDMQAVVADGHLDIWIDQTWGGAAQDWWDEHWKGWTFQLANLLGHGVALRQANRQRPQDSPCRHYKLIETWDGWEPWDTIHRTPGKLEWAIWAFSHATVLERDRLHVPEGAYISWMNDWTLDLLSSDDVDFLTSALTAAEDSASGMEEVFGPLLVFDRTAVEQLHEENPTANASEWLEDQAGLLLKFALPLLAATTPSDVPAVWPEGLLWQLPRAVDPAILERIGSEDSGPTLASGRFDLIDPGFQNRAGVVALGEQRRSGYLHDRTTSPDLVPGGAVHLASPVSAELSPETEVVYSAGGLPLLFGQGPAWMWHAPELHQPSSAQFPRSQIGSVHSYLEASRLLALRSHGLRSEEVTIESPVTVQAWRSRGRIYLLAGNLETGWIGDSRTPRSLTVAIPKGRLSFDPDDAVTQLHELTTGGSTMSWSVEKEELRITLGVAPSGVALVTITPGGRL